MKHRSFRALLVLIFTYLSMQGHEKLMAVGLLLEDEHYGILDTLQPLVDAGIDTFIIGNNQQTSSTVAIAQNFFKERGILPYTVHISASDASEKVHQLITYAQKIFKEIPFLFIPKIGWHVHMSEELLSFCKKTLQESCPVYYMKVVQDRTIERYEPCLIRCAASPRFEGIVRPQPVCKEQKKIPDTIYGAFDSVHYGIIPYKKQLMQEKELLLQQYTSGACDIKTLFQLAQLYADLGDTKQASLLYEQCLLWATPSEEKFLAAYRLGALLDSYTKDAHEQWSLALYYYMKAHETLPYRAEPLIKIAQHYALAKNFNMAYFCASQTLDLPYPSEALLDVENDIYDYVRYDLIGQYAWYVGEFAVGEKALRKGLACNPNNEHLQRNLQFYVNRTKNTTSLDFTELMCYGPLYNKSFLEEDDFARALKKRYEQWSVHDIDVMQPVRIPKIIHQIWLGSSLPIRCQALQASWRAHHPDWEYRLWTDKDIEALQLHNKIAYDAALTYGEKADIARYEILYRYGGLYVDTDFECVRPFDRLHYCCDFYAGLEHGECLIGNSLLGSVPAHSILKQCIETLQCAQPEESSWHYVCNRTGPGHITRCIKEFVMKKDEVIGQCVIFPVGYFFPWYPYFGQVRTAQEALQSLRPETYAVHHWHSSWVK